MSKFVELINQAKKKRKEEIIKLSVLIKEKIEAIDTIDLSNFVVISANKNEDYYKFCTGIKYTLFGNTKKNLSQILDYFNNNYGGEEYCVDSIAVCGDEIIVYIKTI